MQRVSLKWITSGVVGILDKEEIIIEQNGQTSITLTKAYTVGIGMIDVYRNGVLLQKNTYREISSTEILYIDNENPLEAGDVITVRHHLPQNGLSIGNLRVVSYYSDLLNIQDPKFNDIVIVTSLKKFYHYGENGWEEWVIPFTTQNIGMLFKYEKQQILDTFQKTYTLNTITYNPGMGDLLVFINGLLVKDYTEIDSQTIQFDFDELPEGEIEFIVANTDPWEDCNNHEVEYQYDDKGNINKETVVYNNSPIKTTTFEYDAKGSISKEIIIKNGKVITKTYSYDSNDNITGISVSVTTI